MRTILGIHFCSWVPEFILKHYFELLDILKVIPPKVKLHFLRNSGSGMGSTQPREYN
jgi:hypothetical protein